MLGHLETYLEALRTDPLGFLITMVYTWGVILFSLILHECAHGYAALRCGDPTAKMLGRLSLNPARHLDPLGTLCMFLLGFGWARPVPVNPRNYRHYRRDDLLVSLAGVTLNFCIFLVAVLLSCVVNRIMMGEETIFLLRNTYSTGVESYVSPFYWDGYHLMDGNWDAFAKGLPAAYTVTGGGLAGITTKTGMDLISHYFAVPWLLYVQRLLMMLAQINLTLAIFNFLPIPPLDGFHVLNDIIFKGRLQMNRTIYELARVALVVLLMTGILSNFLSTGVSAVYQAVLKGCLMLTGQM